MEQAVLTCCITALAMVVVQTIGKHLIARMQADREERVINDMRKTLGRTLDAMSASSTIVGQNGIEE